MAKRNVRVKRGVVFAVCGDVVSSDLFSNDSRSSASRSDLLKLPTYSKERCHQMSAPFRRKNIDERLPE